MLDDLIRAALNETAANCAMPAAVDDHMLHLVVQCCAKANKGVPNETS